MKCLEYARVPVLLFQLLNMTIAEKKVTLFTLVWFFFFFSFFSSSQRETLRLPSSTKSSVSFATARQCPHTTAAASPAWEPPAKGNPNPAACYMQSSCWGPPKSPCFCTKFWILPIAGERSDWATCVSIMQYYRLSCIILQLFCSCKWCKNVQKSRGASPWSHSAAKPKWNM